MRLCWRSRAGARRGLTDDLRRLAVGEGTVGLLTGAMVSAERYALGPVPGIWLADPAGATVGLGTSVLLLDSAALADLLAGVTRARRSVQSICR